MLLARNLVRCRLDVGRKSFRFLILVIEIENEVEEVGALR